MKEMIFYSFGCKKSSFNYTLSWSFSFPIRNLHYAQSSMALSIVFIQISFEPKEIPKNLSNLCEPWVGLMSWNHFSRFQRTLCLRIVLLRLFSPHQSFHISFYVSWVYSLWLSLMLVVIIHSFP